MQCLWTLVSSDSHLNSRGNPLQEAKRSRCSEGVCCPAPMLTVDKEPPKREASTGTEFWNRLQEISTDPACRSSVELLSQDGMAAPRSYGIHHRDRKWETSECLVQRRGNRRQVTCVLPEASGGPLRAIPHQGGSRSSTLHTWGLSAWRPGEPRSP